MKKTDQIQHELEALRDGQGVLHVDAVWQWAKANPDSALHGEYEWDVRKAAEENWRQTSRQIIAIHVINDDGERKLVSLTIDRTKGGGYRSVDDVIANDELRKVLIKDALMEFKRVKAKYEHVKELASVYEEIDKAEKKYVTGFQPEQQAA